MCVPHAGRSGTRSWLSCCCRSKALCRRTRIPCKALTCHHQILGTSHRTSPALPESLLSRACGRNSSQRPDVWSRCAALDSASSRQACCAGVYTRRNSRALSAWRAGFKAVFPMHTVAWQPATLCTLASPQTVPPDFVSHLPVFPMKQSHAVHIRWCFLLSCAAHVKHCL